MTGTELEQVNPARELVNWVRSEDTRAQIALALPDDVSIDRFERATVTALLAKPELATADKASLYLALLNAAQAGLVPDGKQGTINVYNSKVKDADGNERWIERAQFLVMIGGIRLTLAKYGWTLRTEIVCENDHFEDFSSDGYVVHRKPRPGVDRGPMQGAFAMAVQRDGRRECVVMSKAEIDEVRDKSARGGKSGPWKDWYERMAEKTPGQRLAKKLGLDPHDLIRANSPVGEGDPVALLYGPDDATFTATPVEGDGAALTAGAGAGQQDEPPAERPTTDEPGGSSPDPDDDPEPQPATREEEAPGDLGEIGNAVVPDGFPWTGKTLAEVASEQEGREWIAWGCRNKAKVGADFHGVLASFAAEQETQAA